MDAYPKRLESILELGRNSSTPQKKFCIAPQKKFCVDGRREYLEHAINCRCDTTRMCCSVAWADWASGAKGRKLDSFAVQVGHFKSFSNFNAWLIVFKFQFLIVYPFLFKIHCLLILGRGRSSSCPHLVWPALVVRRRCMYARIRISIWLLTSKFIRDKETCRYCRGQPGKSASTRVAQERTHASNVCFFFFFEKQTQRFNGTYSTNFLT